MRAGVRRQNADETLFEVLVRRLRELASGDNENTGVRETLADLLEQEPKQRNDQLTHEERLLVLNALSLGEQCVDDVMVPRADVSGVDAAASLDEVIVAMRESSHGRLPVFRNTLDDLVGIVHLRDLLPFWGNGLDFDLAHVMRPVLAVPPSMRVIDLLLEMRDRRSTIAVVVDEFGGTDGLVTIGDVVGELLGDLHEEEDADDVNQLTECSDGTLEVDARIEVEELEEELDLELLDKDERDEVDTIGGLIFSLVDRVPTKGERVEHPNGMIFEILDADPRRIRRVRIHPSPNRSSQRESAE